MNVKGSAENNGQIEYNIFLGHEIILLHAINNLENPLRYVLLLLMSFTTHLVICKLMFSFQTVRPIDYNYLICQFLRVNQLDFSVPCLFACFETFEECIKINNGLTMYYLLAGVLFL